MDAMAKVQEKREAIKRLGSGARAGVAGAEWRGKEGMRALDAGEEKSRLRLRTSLQPGSRFGRESWGLKPDRTSSYWLWVGLGGGGEQRVPGFQLQEQSSCSTFPRDTEVLC